jgi:hypothetical protein
MVMANQCKYCNSNLILGDDIAQVEIFSTFVLVHLKDGSTLEFYSEEPLHRHHYDE